MAKIGETEFPEIGLEESIELGKKIALEFSGEVSRMGLARSLGMSQRGGAFSARIGALKMWGVSIGRSRVRVTRDGLRAIRPVSEEESERARSALARNVSLFVEMYKRLKNEPYTPERFAVLLEELSGAGRTEVARRLSLIDRLFGEVRPFLVQERTENANSSGEDYSGDQFRPFAERAVPRDEIIGYTHADGKPKTITSGYITGPDSGRIEIDLKDGKLSLPETVANLDAALSILWARRQLIASIDSADGHPTTEPPRDFSQPPNY